MKNLSGNTAFVTGAASGIGLALTKAFIQEGMQVVLADIEKEPLQKAVAELEEQGHSVLGIQLDVSEEKAVQDALEKAQAHFGNVHVLCNNAGVGSVLKWEEQSYEMVQWVMNVNFGGVFHGIRTFIPHMKEHGEGGHIINTASILGHIAAPQLGLYCASKYAVVALSESLRIELQGSGIGISLLCPGWVVTNIMKADRHRDDTPLVDEERKAQLEEEIAQGLTPESVALQVVEAIKENRFYVFTNPETKPAIQARYHEIIGSFI